MKVFTFFSRIDPNDFSVNKKSWNPSHLPREVKKAQDDLVVELKQELTIHESHPEWEPGWIDDTDSFRVFLEFGFLDGSSDIDSPIKRVLDALQMALVAKGYVWNDSSIYDLDVSKYLTRFPSIQIRMTPLGEEE